MLERTSRPLADDERVRLLERRNGWTAAPERSRRWRWIWTLLGTALSLGVGLLLAALLRACGASETVARLAAIIAATAASVFAYEGGRQMQRAGLQAAIAGVTAIDRILIAGVAAVVRVETSRCARLTLKGDTDDPDAQVGFLFDVGGDGVFFVRTAAADEVVEYGFPADRFEWAEGDGTGVIDESIRVTGTALEPLAALACPETLEELLCHGSVYAVPFDTVLENVDTLTDAAKA